MNKLFFIALFLTLAVSVAAQSVKPVVQAPPAPPQAPQANPATTPASAPTESQAAPRVPRSRTITGRVIDQNNAPVVDVTVVSLPAGLTGMAQNAMTAAKIRPTSSDEQGHFALDNLAPGAYILYADL